jgi:hypothetical protein
MQTKLIPAHLETALGAPVGGIAGKSPGDHVVTYLRARSKFKLMHSRSPLWSDDSEECHRSSLKSVSANSSRPSKLMYHLFLAHMHGAFARYMISQGTSRECLSTWNYGRFLQLASNSTVHKNHLL